MSTPNELYPTQLRLITMTYASNILGYIKRRKDTSFEGVGDKIWEHMQRYKQCLPENERLYYDNLRPVLKELLRYPEAEERASVSGFYEGQRYQILSSLKAILVELESQNDLMAYITSMLTVVINKEEDEVLESDLLVG